MQREVIKYLNVKNVYQNKNLIKKNNKLKKNICTPIVLSTFTLHCLSKNIKGKKIV